MISRSSESDKPRHLIRHMGSILLAGVLVAVPLVVTFWVLNLAYRTIDGITKPFYLAMGWNFPALGFVTTLLLVLLLGFMATNVLGRRILDAAEAFLLKLPLISQVYGSVKQAIESFRSIKGQPKFKRVVYVEYPSPGCKLIAFVTGSLYDEKLGGETVLCFLPTAPNPLTGFVLSIPSDKIIESSLTLEQATKLIMTAGLIAPTQVPLTEANEEAVL